MRRKLPCRNRAIGCPSDDGWEWDGYCEECAIGPCCEDCGRPSHLAHVEDCPAVAEVSHVPASV